MNLIKLEILKGFESNAGNENGNTNLPPMRPTQSSFPPSDNTGRPGSSVFVPASTSGTYSTDVNEGTSSGDYSTTPLGGSGYTGTNTRPSSSSDDLYNIKNKYPTTYPSHNSNRHPQTTGNQPAVVTPTPPVDTNPPQQDNHPLIPHQPEPEHPLAHQPYPIGPDPFPDYLPHVNPPSHHYFLDHDYPDDKHSHFTGIYSHNTPSLHDKIYPGAPHSSHFDPYGSGGLYPTGRYPESDYQLGPSGYGGNRKNGYQVTDNSPDVPMNKRK